MALRVLLADESSTIKKVMQLALSDFGVEVKSVPVGVDVLSVTKSFKPDIVFADVLLTKKNGYEVCQDIKNDPETRHIPVILMWSGFMQIDEDKAAECMADNRLEKPFDADILRSLVSSLVQKTKTNPISNFLSFPEMPEFEETPAQESVELLKPAFADEEEKFASIPEIDIDANPLEIPGEEFSSVPLTTPKAAEEADEGGWAHQDLTKFKLQLPEEEPNDFAAKFVIPQDDELASAQIEEAGDFEEISFAPPKAPTSPKSSPAKPAATAESFVAKVEKSVKEQMMQTLQKGSQKSSQKETPKSPGKTPQAMAPMGSQSHIKPDALADAQPNVQSKVDISSNLIEKVIREEAREVIESICWKLLPEIAERIVREELNKILKDAEKSI